MLMLLTSMMMAGTEVTGICVQLLVVAELLLLPGLTLMMDKILMHQVIGMHQWRN